MTEKITVQLRDGTTVACSATRERMTYSLPASALSVDPQRVKRINGIPVCTTTIREREMDEALISLTVSWDGSDDPTQEQRTELLRLRADLIQ